MVSDCHGQPPVNDTGGGLPQDLHKTDASEVLVVPLRNQNNHLPGIGICKVPLSKRRLDQLDHLIPVGGIRFLIPHLLLEPLVEMLLPHA